MLNNEKSTEKGHGKDLQIGGKEPYFTMSDLRNLRNHNKTGKKFSYNPKYLHGRRFHSLVQFPVCQEREYEEFRTKP